MAEGDEIMCHLNPVALADNAIIGLAQYVRTGLASSNLIEDGVTLCRAIMKEPASMNVPRPGDAKGNSEAGTLGKSKASFGTERNAPIGKAEDALTVLQLVSERGISQDDKRIEALQTFFANQTMKPWLTEVRDFHTSRLRRRQRIHG